MKKGELEAAVALPDGVTRRYHFEDAAHPVLLTGISVETGKAQGDARGRRSIQRIVTGNPMAFFRLHARC